MQGGSPATAFRIRRYSGEAEWCVLRTRSGRFRLRATFFLFAQKEDKNALREKTRSAPNAEGRVLRSKRFPPKNPIFCGGARE